MPGDCSQLEEVETLVSNPKYPGIIFSFWMTCVKVLFSQCLAANFNSVSFSSSRSVDFISSSKEQKRR